ncbi:MAG: L-asparaginase [Paenibacillaceae bacterium]|jgi:L-asparaginase II|nr:L-asparaginase [Paenibacillaceae bacterium]
MQTCEILVRVFRGELEECRHRGYIAATDSDCRILLQCGDPDYVTYARSCAKPLQAISVVEAVNNPKLSDEEVAVICSSHNGEERHLAQVGSILSKIGGTTGQLMCGPHPPTHKETANKLQAQGIEPTSLHNNCSGKHAGMLALAAALGVPAQNYHLHEHPVQQRMLETVAQMAGIAGERIILSVDGCGVPVFGLPLARLASAYALLGTPDERFPAERADACRRIVAALRSHPFLLAGTDRFDSALIEATGGRIIGKMGAEGVFALTIPGERFGLALKIEDGALRALYPAVVEALRQAGALSQEELTRLQRYHRPAVRNWRNEIVGSIEPDFTLHRPDGSPA